MSIGLLETGLNSSLLLLLRGLLLLALILTVVDVAHGGCLVVKINKISINKTKLN